MQEKEGGGIGERKGALVLSLTSLAWSRKVTLPWSLTCSSFSSVSNMLGIRNQRDGSQQQAARCLHAETD